MSNNDPFEAFKNRREIELLEGKFKDQAEVQRKRVDDALAEDDDEAVVENRVTQEMEAFFKDSTDNVEKALEEISGPVAGEAIEEALTRVAEAELTGSSASEETEPPAAGEGPSKLDLTAALDRIRRHKDGAGAGAGHGDVEAPQTPEPDVPPAAPEAPGLDFEFDPAEGDRQVFAEENAGAGEQTALEQEAPEQEQFEQEQPEQELSFLEPGASWEQDAAPGAIDSDEAPVAEEFPVLEGVQPAPADPPVPEAPAESEQPPQLRDLAEEVRELQALFGLPLDQGGACGDEEVTLSRLLTDLRELKLVARDQIQKGAVVPDDLLQKGAVVPDDLLD